MNIISRKRRRLAALAIVEVLPALSGIEVTGITDVSATISGFITANSYSADVKVEYGATASLGSEMVPDNSPFAPSEDAVAFSVELSGLMPDSAVFYRIVVTTSEGPVATDVLQFNTLETEIPVIPAPTGLTATAESDTEISLLWTDNAESDSFTVQRSPNGTDWSDIANPIAPGWTDEGLAPETLYYYRVKSVVDGISSEYSETASATTETAEEPPVDEAVYIDFDNSASGRDGSIANPYNSWSEVTLASDTEYKIKAGTSWTSSSSLTLNGLTNVVITIYGSGDQPEFNYTGSSHAVNLVDCHSCDLGFFDVNGGTGTASLFRCVGNSGAYASGNVLRSSSLYNAHNSSNAGFGVFTDYTDNLRCIAVSVDNVALDGGYLTRSTNFSWIGGTLTRMNQRYLENTNETVSNGDGIQLDGNYDGFHISGLTIDRSDSGTGNKFCIICNNAGVDTYTGIIEGCIFKTNANVATAIHLHRTNGVIVRYNRFEGATQGISLQGASCTNTLIHHNLFYDCTTGIRVLRNYTAIVPNGPSTGNKFFNNVFYHVTEHHIWSDGATIETRNNIHLRAGDSGVALYNFSGSTFTISNNCYGDAATAGTPGTGTNPQIGDPGFVDAANGDFHLQLTSICRNAGIDVSLTEDCDSVSIPQETYPAIGAYEYI